LAIDLAKSNTVSPARIAAFNALKQVEAGMFSSVPLAEAETQLSPLDRALCHELVLGVLRWQLQLDKLIEHFSERKIDSLDNAVKLALRLGIYQTRFLTRVPPSAAVNESVNLVARARLASARPFVNAVLRRAVRENSYSPAEGITDPYELLSVETSHPLWLIERWANAFGIDDAKLFARANNETPPLAIRIVESVADEQTVVDKLRLAGAVVLPSDVAKGAWKVSGARTNIRELVERGEIYIQDEASQLVAEVLNVRSGDRVLDVCAAPGGKTTLIADRVHDTALVFAMDVAPRRLATVAQTVEAHRLKSVRLLLGDAHEPLPFSTDSFDRVLLDAPCSGTGTLRHNPEIRWRLTNDDIKRLAEQQVRFLVNASAVVKRNGLLVYSTCSVEREENEEVVGAFLACQDRFRQIRVPVTQPLLLQDGAVRTWPQRDGTDGFYIAAFQRE
jgi:16S rRNA (cytosine967-C5)-methyltransferase